MSNVAATIKLDDVSKCNKKIDKKIWRESSIKETVNKFLTIVNNGTFFCID